MKTLHLSALTLLTLTGVFSDSSEWGVIYSEPICAVRGSSVSISCTYSYPGSVREVQRVRWCSNNTNTESLCTVPPYVYDSDSPTASGGFEFVGDKTSNCTLLIRNVQFSHSGGYQFRFKTNDINGKYTGLPGATLSVTALELWMFSSSGDRTLKEGDTVNLTCAVNCTPSSPQFVWFKNGERLPESDPLRKTGSEKLVVTGCLSGHREEYLSSCIIKHTYKASVLHLRNLTVGDSGRYSCALKTDESVRSEPVQLNIEGSTASKKKEVPALPFSGTVAAPGTNTVHFMSVFSDSSEWRVNYSEPICAVRGSSVSISCTYFYPGSVREVQRLLWCSNNTNTESYCRDPPYVYDSDSSTASGCFEFVGDKTSNCTLLIRNVQFSHSGGYRFRFITDQGRGTGVHGATLNVTALELWMSSSSGDRTLKEGDSVNLTCAVNCTPSSPQFVWFKNGERLPESGSILHLLTLTVGNSGRYSCALKTDESVRSEPVQLNIGGSSSLLMFTALVIVGLMVFLLTLTILAVIYKRRKKAKSQEENKGSGKKTQGEESTGGEQTEHLTDQVSPPTQTLPQEGDLTYASINIDHKKPKKGKKTEAQEENRGSAKINQSDTLLQEGDVTYASVTIDHKKPKKGPSHPVQQQEDDSVIYSAVVTRPVK